MVLELIIGGIIFLAILKKRGLLNAEQNSFIDKIFSNKRVFTAVEGSQFPLPSSSETSVTQLSTPERTTASTNTIHRAVPD